MRVIYTFPDGLGRPGIGTTAYHQVRELARQGVDVSVYCTSLHGELPADVRVVETLVVAGRRLPHRALGVERSYRYHDLRVATALRKHPASADVVHCWPRATIHTARAAHASGVPTLREVPNTHTAHAYEVVDRELRALGLSPPAGHSHTYRARTLRQEQREYTVADALLVPSEYSRRTFLERGFEPARLELHRYGYDPDRFVARDEHPRERPFTAIFVGRCEPRKGLHHALRAWIDSGAGDRGRFIVCGAFDDDYRRAVEPLLSHPSVEIRGFVADPAVLMRDSDVLLFPSVEEGSALVTYEARACGCVLLVSEAAGARCRDEVDGLVHSPGDVRALTRQLRRLLDDPDLLPRLRKASLSGTPTLTWAAAASELVAIYAKYARSRPAVAA